MGWLVPAHSVFFPTDSAWPWRAASSADGLVTFSWELDTPSGKDAGCPMGPGNTGSGNVLEVWEQQNGGVVGESWDNGTGGGRTLGSQGLERTQCLCPPSPLSLTGPL